MKVLQGLLGLMKKPVFWLIVALVAAVGVCYFQHRKLVKTEAEATRLEDNQTALLSKVEYYRTENGELVGQVNALTLRADELGQLIPKYEKELKSLKIQLRDAKNMAHVGTETNVEIVAPLEPETPPADTSGHEQDEEPPFVPRDFSWRDEWITVEGKVYADTVVCTFVSRDSLTMVAHYQKRKCLFRKKGKLIKYEVKSSNPHTNITNVEYIEVVE